MTAPRSSPDLRSRLQVPLWAALALTIAPVLLLGILLVRDVFVVQREAAAIAQLTTMEREAVAFSTALRTSQVLIRDYARAPTPALLARLRDVTADVRRRGVALGRSGDADSARSAAWSRLLDRRLQLLDSMVAMPPTEVGPWFTARRPGGTVDAMLAITDRVIFIAREDADQRQLSLALRVQTAQEQALALVVVSALTALAGALLVLRAVRGERLLRQRLDIEEARLERTFADAPTGMAIVALDGRFVEVNAALCDMLGYSAAELQARTYAEITHPDDLVGDEALAVQLAAGTIPRYEYEKRYIAKDGTFVPIMLHGSAVRRSDGTLEHFIAQIVDLRAQKTAQAASQNRKAELRSILDGAEDVVFRYDREARVTYVNAAARRVTGRPADALVGLPVEELTVTPADAARWRAAIGRIFATGEGERFEFDHVAPDGIRRWFSVRLTPVRDLSGAVTGVVEFSRDLTALREAELAVREREAEFLSLVESSDDVIIRYDSDLVLRYVNPEVYRSTGIGPEMLLGKPLAELPIGPELAPRWIAAVTAVRDTGHPIRLEYSYPNATGRTLHYDAKMTAERRFDGSIRGVLVASRDITELREAAERLAAHESELRAIVEGTEDFIVRYDERGVVRFVNPAVTRASGRPAEDYLGKTPRALSHDALLGERLTAAIERVLGTGLAETLEYAYQRPTDAIEHYYATRLTPERGVDGRITGVLGLSRDLTDRRRVELEREKLLEELVRAQAAVKTLKGLLPTCAWCHRIKDDHGHWEQMEAYIARRTDAEFSHGLCPDCATKMLTE